jgi:GTP cyclohydrolase II
MTQTAAMVAAQTAAQTTVRVRRRIRMPLARAAGTVAQLVTFDGLERSDDFALVLGELAGVSPLVRVHSACQTGDVFGSARCDCGAQLDMALARLAREGGVLLYLQQEGRGIGLQAKIDAYALQDAGLDTFAANERLGHPADNRDYGAAAQMLQALGMTSVRLLSANPDKVDQLRSMGVAVADVLPLEVEPTDWNRAYLEAKSLRFAAGRTQS